jgi:hypothetical protein
MKTILHTDKQTHKRLKDLADGFGCHPVELVEALLFMAKAGKIDKADIIQAISTVRSKNSGWVAEDASDLLAHFARLESCAREAGDFSTAKQAQANIQRLNGMRSEE